MPALGDIGIELRSLLAGARGIGEFIGRSPGLGLIGRPGLIREGAMTLFEPAPLESVTDRWRSTSIGLADASKLGTLFADEAVAGVFSAELPADPPCGMSA